MHSNVFPPENPGGVTEISMDGNEKVIVKCGAADAPSKRTGRPSARNGEKRKPFSDVHVGFMLTDP